MQIVLRLQRDHSYGYYQVYPELLAGVDKGLR